MTKNSWYFCGLLLAGALGGSLKAEGPAPATSKAVTSDSLVAAKIGDAVILQKEILDTLNTAMPGILEIKNKNPKQFELFYDFVLKSAILERLFAVASAKEADRLMQDPKVKNALESTRKSILSLAYRNDVISKKVTDGEIKKAFDTQAVPEQMVTIGMILVDKEDIAKAIVKELKKGVSFEKLSKSRSIAPNKNTGGEMANVPSSSLPPEINKLAVGTFSDPISIKGKWAIILKKSSKKATLEEATPVIRAKLETDATKTLVEDLSKAIPVVIHDMKGAPTQEVYKLPSEMPMTPAG